MRKTVILAFATAALAVVTVVTDLIRADAGSMNSRASAGAVEQVQTAGGPNVNI